jgi:hypothetical protein
MSSTASKSAKSGNTNTTTSTTSSTPLLQRDPTLAKDHAVYSSTGGASPLEGSIVSIPSSQDTHHGNPFRGLTYYFRQLIGQDDAQRSNVGTQARIVSDAVIGLSDGLTVPFAVTAGLSSSKGVSSRVIIAGGLAELIAGGISMGLGGYLGGRSEAYASPLPLTF